MAKEETNGNEGPTGLRYVEYVEGFKAGYRGYIESKATGKIAFWVGEDDTVTPDYEIDG